MRACSTLTGWIAAMFLPAAALAQAGATQSLDIRIPVAPQPVRIGEQVHVFYELHLTNFAAAPVKLAEVAVFDGSTSAALARFGGDVLGALTGGKGFAENTQPPALAAGMHGVIYMTLPLQPPTPAALTHRMTLEVPVREELRSVTITSDSLPVDATAVPELGPPLRGGRWAALYDPAMARGHRQVLYAVDGHAHLPGRFAIDFFGVDTEGKTHKGSGERPADYYGYGAEVLAVADGVVVAVRDDFSEPATLAEAPQRVAIADATGAYVALDIGGGRFAFYEHLRPGIAVKVGQRVRRGERLGALGLTGQTRTPHLHFHVADANAPLAAEGMPFHFARYRLLGSYAAIAEFGEQPWRALPAPRSIANSLPSPNVVLSFD